MRTRIHFGQCVLFDMPYANVGRVATKKAPTKNCIIICAKKNDFMLLPLGGQWRASSSWIMSLFSLA